EDGIRDKLVTGVQTCALPISAAYRLDDNYGEAVSLALREALFEHGLDIADDDVVREIGARYGVEPLDAGTTRAAVAADWERGKEIGRASCRERGESRRGAGLA